MTPGIDHLEPRQMLSTDVMPVHGPEPIHPRFPIHREAMFRSVHAVHKGTSSTPAVSPFCIPVEDMHAAMTNVGPQCRTLPGWRAIRCKTCATGCTTCKIG